MYTVGAGLLEAGDFIEKLIKHSKDFQTIRDNKKKYYYNIPAAFDIEVTSFYDNGKKRALMYIWQFGIWNYVTYGRTWEEFVNLINAVKVILQLSNEKRLVVYVHNFAYEFQFIRKRFEWEEVFFLDDRKPVYANAHGVEFRCSLKLSGGKPLAALPKDLRKYVVYKQSGALDYETKRTPLTPLTDKELLYCEDDIRVLLCYIQEKIENDGDITKIPLTNTGYVRNYCRKACYSNWRKYRNLMEELTITPFEYSQLKSAFQGGFVHANAHYVEQVLHGVGSYDFKSSYPASMVLEKFPMSRAKHIQGTVDETQLSRLLLTKCCIFDIEIWGLIPKRHQDHPISSSKCRELEWYTLDNGRVVTASHLKTTITEQDYFVYKEFYDWERCEIRNFMYYEKQYLPKNFVLAILDFFEKKTTLDGIAEEYVNYMLSKNMLNAAYGMIVTDIVRDEHKYPSDHDLKKQKEREALQKRNPERIEEVISKYNDNVRRFLYYPWGVWVTAYSRANLFSGIIELDEDYVYSDTDSVKGINIDNHEEYFKRYNDQIIKKIKAAAAYHKIPEEKFSPLNPKGKKKTLGIWDFEGVYDSFKTLGAKRYLVEKKGVFTLTLAGANKKKAMEYLLTGDPFNGFSDKLVIPKESSGRLLLTYIDDETEGDIVDANGVQYHYTELSSIHMEASEYHLSMSDSFIKYLKGIRDISE